MAHLLWADDKILCAETENDLQRLLDCLFRFCSSNQMIVNETKTKCMVFRSAEEPNLFFNGLRIEVVNQYKYLGTMISPISRPAQDIFANNYDYLTNQARRATFAMKSRVKDVATPPPLLVFEIFDISVNQMNIINIIGDNIYRPNEA